MSGSLKIHHFPAASTTCPPVPIIPAAVQYFPETYYINPFGGQVLIWVEACLCESDLSTRGETSRILYATTSPDYWLIRLKLLNPAPIL